MKKVANIKNAYTHNFKKQEKLQFFCIKKKPIIIETILFRLKKTIIKLNKIEKILGSILISK